MSTWQRQLATGVTKGIRFAIWKLLVLPSSWVQFWCFSSGAWLTMPISELRGILLWLIYIILNTNENCQRHIFSFAIGYCVWALFQNYTLLTVHQSNQSTLMQNRSTLFNVLPSLKISRILLWQLHRHRRYVIVRLHVLVT